MFFERFLRNRQGATIDATERATLEASISEVRTAAARSTLVRAGDPLNHSTLLVEGFLCRYIDDRHGRRQLVAVHVPGDFVDLHGYPLRHLDHDIAALTPATVATVPHGALDRIVADQPELARKLWYSTLLDAATHRAWLFRLGRLNAEGRVAHFLCELNARLMAVGLSDGRRFAFGVTQTDLAEACGITNVHINRVLRSLREDGLCAFRSQTVDLLDLGNLARRGEFDPQYLYLEGPAVGGAAETGR